MRSAVQFTHRALLAVLPLMLLQGCGTFDWSKPKAAAQNVAQGISNAIAPQPDFSAVTEMRQYRVLPGDELQVTLKGTTTLLGTATVQSDGHANLPRKGDQNVSNMSLDDIGALIEKGGGNGVMIALRAPAPIYVVGEVANPGAVTWRAGLTLDALLTEAGGATHKADLRSVYIKPRGSAAETKTDFDPALPILPGDVVRLDERYF
ncbi:MAG: SLBB domain-containing protein [Alphaproteobacteria bacterium]